MFVQQFFLKGLAHSSYLLGGTHACAIVDPRREVQIYLNAAAEMGMEITHIIETHLHADFISGHMDLADATGATIYAPSAGDCAFGHIGVQEGETFGIDDLSIAVLETPGHTPEHVSYVVTDTARGAEPVAVFTGDTLFVGDVGRPDLFPGMAEELASKLFDSVRGKLMKLPDFCEVYPAHGAGSLCGRAMGAKRTSTIGYEKLHNPAVGIRTRKAFVKSLTTEMPPAPDHFARCSAMNAAGPALVRKLRSPAPLAPRAFARRAARERSVVLDLRTYEAFGGQHVPGAVNVDVTGNFSTFAGWVLPMDRDILLVADDASQVERAVIGLHRVGLDSVAGHLEGGMFAWATAGLPVEHVPQLSAHELHEMMTEGDSLALVDARAPAEFEATHVEGALNIPAPDVRTRHGEIARDVPVAVVCSSGYRSSLAASLLKRAGRGDVRNVAGGMTGYSAAGYAPECPLCVAPHGPRHMGGRTVPA